MKKALAILLTLVMATGLMSGCGAKADETTAASTTAAAAEKGSSTETPATEAATTAAAADLSGSIVMSGSTSME